MCKVVPCDLGSSWYLNVSERLGAVVSLRWHRRHHLLKLTFFPRLALHVLQLRSVARTFQSHIELSVPCSIDFTISIITTKQCLSLGIVITRG